MGIKHMNALNMDAAQRGKVNEQHQNVVEQVVERDPIVFSTTHYATPQTLTQPWAVNVHHDDNMNLFNHLMNLSLHNNHGDL
jgi:hypothetical protein